MDPRDNALHALKARVVADQFDWGDDHPPHTPLAQTVLYELHVKGFTKLHPSVPEALRGSYAGLASDAALAHLKALNVTAVNLLPVHQHIDEGRLVKLDLSNYWGSTRSASSARARGLPRALYRVTAACRCATSSARWSGGCTRPASR